MSRMTKIFATVSLLCLLGAVPAAAVPSQDGPEAIPMTLDGPSEFKPMYWKIRVIDGVGVVAGMSFTPNPTRTNGFASNPVPEPSAALAFSMGALFLGARLRRRS